MAGPLHMTPNEALGVHLVRYGHAGSYLTQINVQIIDLYPCCVFFSPLKPASNLRDHFIVWLFLIYC